MKKKNKIWITGSGMVGKSLIKKLSECSGHLGIAGGQYLDLNYEKKKISCSNSIQQEKARY